MLTLYVLRHGLAGDPSDWVTGPDSQRPLTARGKERMKAQAHTMAALDLGITTIFSSPYTRARQTAEIVAEGLQRPVTIEHTLAPGFSLAHLSNLLDEQGWSAAAPDPRAVLFVGHEPDLSTLIGDLIAGPHSAARVIVKKGTLARVDLHSLSPLRGTLAWLIPSRVLAGE